jgi:hypothetical protein
MSDKPSVLFICVDLVAAGTELREVTAREVGAGFTGSWWLAGYGICAN